MVFIRGDYGSSPLVRGQHTSTWIADDLRRIIPARAGPTPGRWSGHVEASDHPRSCGANLTRHAGLRRQCGSSPLVRGQQAF